MALKIAQEHVDAMRQHGARDYPGECCGVMLGVETAGVKLVRQIVPIRNLRRDPARAETSLPLAEPGKESERNRFLIDREEVRRVETEARVQRLDIVGYYHSHPDHPARPSDYDRDHAWPWLSYVIIGVEAGSPRAHRSWVLKDDRSGFESEEMEIFAPGDGVAAGSEKLSPPRRGE